MAEPFSRAPWRPENCDLFFRILHHLANRMVVRPHRFRLLAGNASAVPILKNDKANAAGIERVGDGGRKVNHDGDLSLREKLCLVRLLLRFDAAAANDARAVEILLQTAHDEEEVFP